VASHRRTLAMLEELVRASGAGPWLVSDVRAHGWTDSQILWAVRAGRLARLHRGVLALPTSGPREAIRAALLVAGHRAVASHGSAAVLHDLWLPAPRPATVELTVPGEPDRTDHGMRIHGSRLPADFVTEADGMRVTTVSRTAVDLARGRSLPQALVALDSAARTLALADPIVTPASLRSVELRRELLHKVRPQLDAAYDGVRTWPGTVVVRGALALLDLGSESPFESRSRAWIITAGLPAPILAFPARGGSGRLYFADMAWPERRVLGEADGTGKYGIDEVTIRTRLRAERERQRDLEDAGWTVVRWDSREAAPRVTARLARALRL